MGEIELAVAGIVAAENGMAAAAAATADSRREHSHGAPVGGLKSVSASVHDRPPVGGGTWDSGQRPNKFEAGQTSEHERAEGTTKTWDVVAQRDGVKPCGVEAWFPLFVSGRGVGNREQEVAGEVRLSFRFLSTDFMLQRELTAGADEGDNGPVGVLRYALERQPGKLFFLVRCCRSLQKAMIGDRAPQVEASLRPGGWKCTTRRQAGLNPMFNENMAVELLWTPQDFNSPELILEVKDKALGGGRIAVVRVPVTPFILHPRMQAEIWYPLLRDGTGATSAGVFCGLVYVPSVGVQSTGSSPASYESAVDPELAAIAGRAQSGVVHVQVISARGLPASSKDPQIGVRLRVRDHRRSSLPPFQRTAAVQGGRGEPHFDTAFLLSLRQEAPGFGDESGQDMLGRTPVLEVEASCARGRGRVLGTVEIPIFSQWFMGHMTRTWYPMRSADGEGEAGSVFIGLQFLADGGSGRDCTATSAPANCAGRRRFLFVEVRQGRDLRRACSMFGQDPAVHVELLGSGARGKTPPARNGGTDPEWPDGAGLLVIPYQERETGEGWHGRVSEVLRISVFNERGDNISGEGAGAARIPAEMERLIGQCDWHLPVEDLDLGQPISAWHALWTGGTPAGDVYLRCKVGDEGEALDNLLPPELQHPKTEGTSALSPLASGNYHVEFLQVRGFERILQRMRPTPDPSAVGSSEGSGLWEGRAYLAAALRCAGDEDAVYASPAVGVASRRAVAVSASGQGGSRLLCAQISMSGGRLGFGDVAESCKRVRAVSCIPPEKLLPLTEVPGSELLEWFPMVAVAGEGVGGAQGSGEADTGQVLLSVRYAPLAVGVLEVSVCEAELADNKQSPIVASGTFKALTRLLPAQTGASMGHKVRSTPRRKGSRRILGAGEREKPHLIINTTCSWEDARPHRMRFNNGFNKRPTTLHICVIQRDRMVGFVSVAAEGIVQGAMSNMAREIADGNRRPRGSAHDLGPVGLREEDFSELIQTWYSLQAPSKREKNAKINGQPFLSTGEVPVSKIPTESVEIGRVRVALRFAPHPKVLQKKWQEGAAVVRAKGITAMKAIFYRLNRSGNLIVETEDLRAALIDAVDEFILKSTTTRAEKGVRNKAKTSRSGGGRDMAQAGEFVLLMAQALNANQGPGDGRTLSELAVEAMFTIMKRDRGAEVSFAEFCVFLSKAAAKQAEGAVSLLMSELAEDNNDTSDNDSEDNPSTDGDGNLSPIGLVEEYGQGGSGPNQVTTHSSFLKQPQEKRTIGGSGDSLLPDQTFKQSIYQTARHASAARAAIKNDATHCQQDFHNSAINSGSESTRNLANDSLPAETFEGVEHVPKNSTTKRHSVGNNRGKQVPVGTAQKTPRSAKKQRFSKEIKYWAVRDVLHWLSDDMQLPQHAQVFRDASVDGLVLCHLTDKLLQDMGVPVPLHRLKIVRHAQELRTRQRASDQTTRATSSQHYDYSTHTPYSSPRLNSGKSSDRGSSHRLKRPGGTSTASSPDSKSQPPMAPPLKDGSVGTTGRQVRGEEGEAPSLKWDIEQAGQRATLSNQSAELFPQTAEWGFPDDEEAFKRTMNDVRDDFLLDTGPSATAFFRLKKRKRRLPANSTTSEVHEVVKMAMREAAAELEDQHSAEDHKSRRIGKLDYPPAWWGSSDGGSMSENNSTKHDEVAPNSFGKNEKARLLFYAFVSFHEGVSNRPRTETGLKLTRHRLEIGIRSLLGIEMRWEQFDMFLNSIANLRTHGFLTVDQFADAFGFRNPRIQPATPRSTSSPHSRSEAASGSIGIGYDSGCNRDPAPTEVIQREDAMAAQGVDKLRQYVLGIADTLRACRLTLEGMTSTFDRRGTGKVHDCVHMFPHLNEQIDMFHGNLMPSSIDVCNALGL